MSIVKEFKEFALKGNVVDLAIGVIIGAAFGKIIDSLVKDIMMPIISWILGGDVDFTNLFIVLGENPDNITSLEAAKTAGLNIFAYGNFITVSINFILLALVVFLFVKLINAARKKEAEAPAAPAPTPEDIVLLREIRDQLKNK